MDVSKVGQMGYMFQSAKSFNGDLSKWDVSKVTKMDNMFMKTTSFNGDLSKWDVSHVRDMKNMFLNAAAFNSDISKWDVSKVTDMTRMLSYTNSFNGDISKWDVSKVRHMGYMFHFATSFNGDLSKWDVSKVTDMDNMFADATSFKQKLCGDAWVNSKATKNGMFDGSPGSIPGLPCTTTNAVISSTPQQTTSKPATSKKSTKKSKRSKPSKVAPSRRYPTRSRGTRRPAPDRELIVRASNTIIASTTSRILCPSCGTFEKSGRFSCCAPGGAWFKNCGGVGNKNIGHRWFEGIEACRRKFKRDVCHVNTNSHRLLAIILSVVLTINVHIYI